MPHKREDPIKKIIIFILLAFIPMVLFGIILRDIGGEEFQVASDPSAVLTKSILGAVAMIIPFLAVVITNAIFEEPKLKDLDISFKVNRWWWIGWLLMPIIALATFGVSLLDPDSHWSTKGEMAEIVMKFMPYGLDPSVIFLLYLVYGMVIGATVNALFALGEEVAWRSFLPKKLAGWNFVIVSLFVGLVCGLWNIPLVSNGLNYPDNPAFGRLMVVVISVLFSPILLYFRVRSGSVVVPAIMHGTFNAVMGLSNVFVQSPSHLFAGGTGIACVIVLFLADVILFIYDRCLPYNGLFNKKVFVKKHSHHHVVFDKF